MSPQSFASQPTPHGPFDALQAPASTGFLELGNGREVRVDVMQSYGSGAAHQTNMHDVHHMKVHPDMISQTAKPHPLATLKGRLGGLALASVVVMVVSWQLAYWVAVLAH